MGDDAADDSDAPEDRGPNPNCASQEACENDGRQESYIGAK